MNQEIKKIKRPNYNIKLEQKPKKIPKHLIGTGIPIDCPECGHAIHLQTDRDGSEKIVCTNCGNEFYGY